MSKKETEFDRYDRMRRMEKEQEIQKRKLSSFSDGTTEKKGGKLKSGNGNRRDRFKVLDEADDYDYDYDYV